MAKRSSNKEDFAQAAFRVMQEATGDAPKTLPPDQRVDPTKNPAAVALGRLGGLKGGKARAASLSKNKRSEIAKNAATARWSNK